MGNARIVVFVSQIIVVVLAITVIVLAVWGIFVPGKLVKLVASTMDQQWGIYIAVIVRLFLGAALIIAAPASRFPIVFQALGIITIIAAVALALMGRERIRRYVIQWFRQLSAPVVRLWLLFGTAFGGFLVYGVL